MYGPNEDDQVTHLFREQARQEELVEAFLSSLHAPDARRELITFRHQREFLLKRKVQRFQR